jgi:uncharacterized protein (TIGR03435 family)
MRLAVLLLVVASAVAPAGVRQAQSPPAFDVVSIKPAEFPSVAYFEGFSAGAGGTCGFSRFTPVGPRVSFGKTTACSLIRMAYDVMDYQIVAMPPRMSGKEQSAWYEVEARAAAGTTLTVEQTRLMLQTLLADRFKLKFHREPRERPVYALVVMKEGHKLGPVPAACQNTRGLSGGAPGTWLNCTPVTMATLVFLLSRQTDRPVVDRTRLVGTYSFSLQWSATEPLAGDGTRPSIFTAVQEQLGLRLEAAVDKVDAIVVDAIEPPAPN